MIGHEPTPEEVPTVKIDFLDHCGVMVKLGERYFIGGGLGHAHALAKLQTRLSGFANDQELIPVLSFSLHRSSSTLVVALDEPCDEEALKNVFQQPLTEHFRGSEPVSFRL